MRVALPTRAAVLLVAVFAAVSFGPATGGLARENADKFDEPALTGPLAEPLLAPLARWDSVWYLRIADSGYGESAPRAAFFPLYPLLIRSLGTLLGGSEAALLVVAYLVSLIAFVAALALLYKLVVLERGRQVAPATLLLLAVFPAAVFFGAPYSESLFLLLAVGAFYAARTGRWAWAGTLRDGRLGHAQCGSAAGDPAGHALVELAGRAIAPARAEPAPSPHGAATRAVAAWLCASRTSGGGRLRRLARPGRGRRAALPRRPGRLVARAHRAARRRLGRLHGGARRRAPARVGIALARVLRGCGGDPFRIAALNIMLFGTLVFAVCACVGVLRRLPKAYGAWVAASLVLPLTFPVTPQPLMSLPRFVAVLFPIFVWLAIVCDERRITTPVAAFSAIGLGLFTAQYASWHWIS